jgi:hypothetical protein
VLCTSALLATAVPAAARAATFQAACSGKTGDPASLAAAIASANAATGEDVVALGAGCVYTLTEVANSWYGPNGLPAISSDVTIEGHGATITRAASAPPFRVFFIGADPENPRTKSYVSPGTAPGGGRLTLREVTIAGGLAKGGDSYRGGGGAGMGGAIFSQGALVVERSTLTGNTAQGGSAQDSLAGRAGGGVGSSSVGSTGGGFGGGSYPGGGVGGSGTVGEWGGGGGAGFAVGENGNSNAGEGTDTGGGNRTGLGGNGDGASAAGDGSGGGANICCGKGASGGSFGRGGAGGPSGGGGGIGGGGGSSTFGGGGGGFGGGGGAGDEEEKMGGSGSSAGSGGFGGGGAVGYFDAPPGFGGGTPSEGAGGGGAGMGGAIFNMQGSLRIDNSTIAGNNASGGDESALTRGRGIAGGVFNMSGTFEANDSTFAGNAGGDFAAQIFNLVYDGYQERNASTTLRDTIVAGGLGPVDVASNRTDYIIPANLGTANADLSQSDLVRASAALEHGTLTGKPLTVDPLLGPLQANGGPTMTVAPTPTSPVIDAGSFCLPSDQRGLPRRDNGETTCDIGAYETQDAPVRVITPPPPPPPPTLSAATLTSRRFRVARGATAIAAKKAPLGTTLRVTLSAPAKLQITITTSAPGLRSGRSCLAPTAKLRRRHAKRCRRTLTIGTLTRANKPQGPNRIPFSGRIGHHALSPGAYNADLSASNAGGRSRTLALAFVIVR